MALSPLTIQRNERELPIQQKRELQDQTLEQEWKEGNILRESQRRARLAREKVDQMDSGEGLETSEFGAGGMERVSIFSYSAPLIAALFKDILDFSFILALPGIGTIMGICFDILIFLLLIFPKQKYRLAMNMRLAIVDALILMGLVPLEGLAFPFNLLPFTMAAVCMIYTFDKKFVAAQKSKRFD